MPVLQMDGVAIVYVKLFNGKRFRFEYRRLGDAGNRPLYWRGIHSLSGSFRFWGPKKRTRLRKKHKSGAPKGDLSAPDCRRWKKGRWVGRATPSFLNLYFPMRMYHRERRIQVGVSQRHWDEGARGLGNCPFDRGAARLHGKDS